MATRDGAVCLLPTGAGRVARKSQGQGRSKCQEWVFSKKYIILKLFPTIHRALWYLVVLNPILVSNIVSGGGVVVQYPLREEQPRRPGHELVHPESARGGGDRQQAGPHGKRGPTRQRKQERPKAGSACCEGPGVGGLLVKSWDHSRGHTHASVDGRTGRFTKEAAQL